MKLRVDLNGTSENPYHRYGLSQNPFPQLAKHEYSGACRRIQYLGGDPIPDTQYIRKILEGFSDEFVELCCERFVPGKYISFNVEFPL